MTSTAAAPKTYRVIASDTRREVVANKHPLTLEQAQALKERLRWDMAYCYLICRVEECPAQEEPAETPAPAPAKPTRKPRRPFDALDQERRIAAAIVQAGDYDFTPHADPGSWICDGPRGSFLVTEEGGCSCEDATYTTGPAGARCKHAVMLGHRLIEMGAGMTGAPLYPLSPADLARPVRATIAA